MYSSSCFNPCKFQFVCLWVQDVNLGWFLHIVSLIRKIGSLKMGFRVWKFSTSPFMTLEISYIIKWLVEQFGNELNDCKQIARAVHKRSECNFFDPLQFFPKLLGTPFNTFLNCTASSIVRIAPHLILSHIAWFWAHFPFLLVHPYSWITHK